MTKKDQKDAGRRRTRTKRTLALFFLMLVLEFPQMAAYAADSSGDEEYNFNWLDPDKKIYVLQNRKFTKTGHIQIGGMVGSGLSSAYRTMYSFDGRLAYYINETWGLETFFNYFTNSENGTFKALENAVNSASVNALPVVRELRSQYGLLVHYVPWYAKINVFNQILYFDWYLAGGVGTLQAALDTRTNPSQAPNYVSENHFAFYVATGHQYHVSRNFLVRLDFMGTIFQALLFGNSAAGGNTWVKNYTFSAGVGFQL